MPNIPSVCFSTGPGWAMMKAPSAAPRMISTSKGWTSTIEMAAHREVAAEDRAENDEDADNQTHELTPTPNKQPASGLPAFCRFRMVIGA